jgi:hypothetical protein
MCQLGDKFTRNTDVMWKRIGSDIVTLNLKTHQYHVLNEAAALIFEHATGEQTVEAMGHELAKQFKIERGQAVEDARETAEGMVKLGLLTSPEPLKAGYNRPAIREVTESDFRGAIAGTAVVVCRSLLGGA